MSRTLLITVVAFGLLVAAGAVSAQNDPIGKIDTLTLVVEELSPGKWMISAQIWNDEELAAFDIPIKYTAGMAKLVVDSVSYKKTRMENFAQKLNPIDTAKQVMHFGGFAYMSPDKPPMAPGNGEVARIYISATGDKQPGTFAVDTATIAPNNTLMLVDKEAKIIVPAFRIISKEAAGEKKTPEGKK